MGAEEQNTPSKPSKPSSATQEAPATPSYPDWNAMQAYYGAGANPFFASTVASPPPHPYMWGSQHPLMAPYGTPVPYPAMYPPGAVYAHHPSMVMTPSPTLTNAESEGKAEERKDCTSRKPKRSLGNTSLIGSKAGEGDKATSGSGNDGTTQSAESAHLFINSAESGSSGSLDASDEDTNEHDYTGNMKGSFDKMLADGANAQGNTVPGNAIVSMPATNLNIGMDLWNTSPASTGAVKMRSNSSGVPSATVGHDGFMRDQWVQDERELKRQKRKQSNRESARRSRLRKQAECEDLQVRVETLHSENRTLREELQRLSEQCEKLTSENDSVKEELCRLYGPDVLSNLETSIDEGNS